MELDQLRHFLRVAELANFTRAAEACFLSQSALSRSIARLEEELGQPLFERHSRQTVLTQAGNILLGKAKQILAMVDDVRMEINDDGETGELHVAAIPTIAPFFLPDLLKRFHCEAPQSRLHIQEDTTANLLRDLHDGLLDVIFAAKPIENRSLKVEPLFEEELLLVLNANHPLLEQKSIRIADTESLPFILLGEAHCLSESIISFCRQKSFHPVSVERTSQLAMVQELVALEHGISLIPQMARQFDKSTRRVYRSLAGTKPTRTIVMVSNPNRFHTKLQKRFQDFVRKTLKQPSTK